MMDALLVYDSATMRLRMRRLLETKRGVTVTDHADPEAALVEAQMRAFDLVLVIATCPPWTGSPSSGGCGPSRTTPRCPW